MNILSQTEGILAEAGAELTRDAGIIISQDILDILDHEEQLTDPSQVGSALGEVIPQEGFRVKQLIAMGRSRPWTPRWNTGLMASSIRSESMGLNGMVDMGGFDLDVAEGQQMGNPGYKWGKMFFGPIPARPFFGISDRALQNVETKIKETETKIIQRLEALQLDPVDVTVNG